MPVNQLSISEQSKKYNGLKEKLRVKTLFCSLTDFLIFDCFSRFL